MKGVADWEEAVSHQSIHKKNSTWTVVVGGTQTQLLPQKRTVPSPPPRARSLPLRHRVYEMRLIPSSCESTPLARATKHKQGKEALHESMGHPRVQVECSIHVFQSYCNINWSTHTSRV